MTEYVPTGVLIKLCLPVITAAWCETTLFRVLAGMSFDQASAEGAVVTPYEDGPLIVRGRFVVTTQDGHPIDSGRRTIALCRCGRSAIKPFCDGTHVRTGFRAPDVRARHGSAAEFGDRGGGAPQPVTGIPDTATQPAE